jgi:hypothetical protein
VLALLERKADHGETAPLLPVNAGKAVDIFR